MLISMRCIRCVSTIFCAPETFYSTWNLFFFLSKIYFYFIYCCHFCGSKRNNWFYEHLSVKNPSNKILECKNVFKIKKKKIHTCGWHPTTMNMKTPCKALIKSVTYQKYAGPPTAHDITSATHVTPITITNFMQTRPSAALWNEKFIQNKINWNANIIIHTLLITFGFLWFQCVFIVVDHLICISSQIDNIVSVCVIHITYDALNWGRSLWNRKQ